MPKSYRTGSTHLIKGQHSPFGSVRERAAAFHRLLGRHISCRCDKRPLVALAPKEDTPLAPHTGFSNSKPPVTIMKMTAVAPSAVVMCRQPRPITVFTDVPRPSAPMASRRPQVDTSTSMLLTGV